MEGTQTTSTTSSIHHHHHYPHKHRPRHHLSSSSSSSMSLLFRSSWVACRSGCLSAPCIRIHASACLYVCTGAGLLRSEAVPDPRQERSHRQRDAEKVQKLRRCRGLVSELVQQRHHAEDQDCGIPKQHENRGPAAGAVFSCHPRTPCVSVLKVNRRSRRCRRQIPPARLRETFDIQSCQTIRGRTTDLPATIGHFGCFGGIGLLPVHALLGAHRVATEAGGHLCGHGAGQYAHCFTDGGWACVLFFCAASHQSMSRREEQHHRVFPDGA